MLTNKKPKKLFEINGLDEASRYINNHSYGCFSILIGSGKERRQRSYLSKELPEVCEFLSEAESNDIWISQCEFKSKARRIVNLLRIPMSFIDLDTYNTEYADYSPESLASLVIDRCDAKKIPHPSVVIFSGRGLQVKWLYEHALPARALPRWNLTQQYLGDIFKDFGADVAARDASRVLRLVGSVNQKSGKRCRVVHFDDSTHSFDALADTVLPLSRLALSQKRAERAERKSSKKENSQTQLSVVQGGKTDNLKRFGTNQLAWDRLHDLRELFKMRGGVEEKKRTLSIFWMLNFMCLSGQIHSKNLIDEAQALAHEVAPNWTLNIAELQTLHGKAEAYNAGKRIELHGKSYVPLYTPKNSKLIELFSITEEEQAKLRTIISPGISKARRLERDKNRKEQERRRAGMVERSEFEAQSLTNQKPWDALGISRATYYRRKKKGEI